MLVSNNVEKIQKARFWATQSRDQARHYQHSELGYNYRMSNISAGIGRGQLKVLDDRVAKKKYIYDFYKRELGDLEGIRFMPVNDWDEPNYWLSCMTRSEGTRLNSTHVPYTTLFLSRHYQHSELGYNYRMSNISAEIGRGQLKVLDDRVAKKKYIYDFYKRELGDLEGIRFMPVNDWDEPNYWLSCMTVHDKIDPIEIMEALEKENIESRPLWKPMHKQPYFEKYDYVGEKVAEELFSTGICLPSDTKMTDEDLSSVVNILKGHFKKNARVEKR